MLGDVLGLGKILGTRIQRRAEIIDLGQDAVRRTGVCVSGVVVRRRCSIATREESGKRIDPCTRTKTRARIEAGRVRIGTTRAEVGTADAVAAKSAEVLGQCRKAVLHLRLSDLFKPLVIVSSAAHAVHVLRNDGVIVVGQGKPVKVNRSGVARIGADREADLRARSRSELCKSVKVADDNVRSRGRSVERVSRQNFICDLAVDDLSNLDRTHCGRDVDLADDRAGVGRSAEFLSIFVRQQDATAADVQQVLVRVVVILVALDVEENVAGLGIADNVLVGAAGKCVFDNKLAVRFVERTGQRRRGLRDDRHAAGQRAAELVVENDHREIRVVLNVKTQRVHLRSFCSPTGFCDTGHIQIERGASVRNDHLFERAGVGRTRLFTGTGDHLVRTVTKQYK